MSVVNDYRATQAAIKELQERLQELEGSDEFKNELAFETELRELLGRHNKSLKQVIEILSPNSEPASANKGKGKSVGGERGARRVKRYTHPTSGEVVETKGGNHKTLKLWKQEHGAETVESWGKYV